MVTELHSDALPRGRAPDARPDLAPDTGGVSAVQPEAFHQELGWQVEEREEREAGERDGESPMEELGRKSLVRQLREEMLGNNKIHSPIPIIIHISIMPIIHTHTHTHTHTYILVRQMREEILGVMYIIGIMADVSSSSYI